VRQVVERRVQVPELKVIHNRVSASSDSEGRVVYVQAVGNSSLHRLLVGSLGPSTMTDSTKPVEQGTTISPHRLADMTRAG